LITSVHRVAMIAIKIECVCGQHYTFEVEPVAGRMPAPVACPTCGTNGTAAANEMIAQSMAEQAAASVPVPAGGPLRIAPVPASAHQPAAPVTPARSAVARPGGVVPGQAAHTQALFEARAKISWGDPPKEVLKYLMIQGFSYQEASAVVNEMFGERAATIRANGIKYIIGSVPIMCIPAAAYFGFRSLGLLLSRTYLTMMLVTMVIGLIGVWLLIKGIFMVAAPTSESGDVAEQ